MSRAGWRLTFRDFMELALYHPAHGYYAGSAERIGKRGDYVTSPELSPLFGRCIGRFLAEKGIDRVLELGAGTGALAAELCEHFQYLIVERSPGLREAQQRRLRDRARWLEAIPARFEGAVISNELLDALPVHRIFRDQERFVRSDWSEELRPYSTDAIAAYFESLGLQPAGEAEVNLDAIKLMSAVYAELKRGLILTIDYGYEADELFIQRPQGTFMTYAGQQAGSNPYDCIGYRDMTSHVDFTSLIRLGEQHGWQTGWFTTQADFLARYGIGELLVELQGQLSVAEYYAGRQAIVELLNPAGMGGFRVLVQTR